MNVNDELSRVVRANQEWVEAYVERCRRVGCTVSVVHDDYLVILPENYPSLSKEEQIAIFEIVHEEGPFSS